MPNEETYFAYGSNRNGLEEPILKFIGRDAYVWKDGKWERSEYHDYVMQDASAPFTEIDEAKANELIGK